MEMTVPVNDMLSDEVTKINYTLLPPTFHGDVRRVRLVQQSLSKLIDTLGVMSASEQGLNKAITTGDKLRNTQTHTLYLLKDPAAKGGQGEVIGLLKVGRKHLFLFDEENKVCEVEPLCVLDFYVQKDRQRHGYGKILFDHMLQDNGATAQELAIDGPSTKMEQFLRRGYGMDRLLRQSNNFAVAPQFFTQQNLKSISGRSSPVITPAVGRFAASKPHSTIGAVIHGGGSSPPKPNGNIEEKPIQVPATISPVAVKPEEILERPVDDNEVQNDAEKMSPARPSTLSVEPIAESAARSTSPAGSTPSRRPSQLTERGYVDMKFYHNRLW